MSQSVVLSVHDLWFAYPNGQREVLRGVSFEVRAGSVHAILGPNGAGKSTLLHLILGIHRPLRGEIRLNGQSLSALARPAVSRQIALVPQREQVPFEYRVLEYVLLGRTPHLDFLQMPRPEDVQAAQAALERLGLSHLADRKVSALSGGEHQLVLVARAVAQGTPVVLLDEPTAHLDLSNKRRILVLLRELAREGRAILLTTHDPEVALAVADHCLLMRGGRILHQGPPAEVFTTERLSQTYGAPLQVLSVDGTKVVLLEMPARG